MNLLENIYIIHLQLVPEHIYQIFIIQCVINYIIDIQNKLDKQLQREKTTKTITFFNYPHMKINAKSSI